MAEPRDSQFLTRPVKRQLSNGTTDSLAQDLVMRPVKRPRDDERALDLRNQAGPSAMSQAQASGSDLVYGAVQLQGENVNVYGNVYSGSNMSFTTNYVTLQAADTMQEQHLFSRLQPSARADYKYGVTSREKHKLNRSICTPGTRKQVLQNLVNWVEDDTDNSNNLFLLCGPAGSGKSTIACTIAHLFDATAKETVKAAMQVDQYPSQTITLAASFFCSRQFEETSRMSAIVPTLGHQIALKIKPFADTLQASLEAVSHWVHDQLERLLGRPWSSVMAMQPQRRLIIIEAIDELGIEDSRTFLKSLVEFLQNSAPVGLKFLVTSREGGGLIKFAHPLQPQYIYRLQDVEKSQVANDIRTYLEAALPSIGQPELDDTVAYSDGLFICAATIVRYLDIYQDTPKVRNRKLRALLANLSKAFFSLEAMDQLYHQILSEAFTEIARDPEYLADYLSILHTFVSTFIPASPSTAADLANATGDEEIEETLSEIAPHVLSRLHAVLHPDAEGNVFSYHQSFSDFIFDQARSGQYYCDRAAFNARITTSCFRIMDAGLKFNIANIDTSFGLDSDIPGLHQTVKRNISPALAYACQHWPHHLNITVPSTLSPFHHSVSAFVSIKALFWIEAMNLLGHQARCENLLRLARDWVLKAINADSKVAQQLWEAACFALYFAASLASSSTPHLYISALATWPQDNGLISAWRRLFPHIPCLEYRGQPNRTLAKIDVGSCVYAVAISKDGTMIASGSRDGMVRLWETSKGLLIATLEGHSDRVVSVAFSTDGTKVLSSSWDKSVRVWDVSARKLLVTLEGHTRPATCAAFSNDGTRIASGSADKSVCVWDALKGTLLTRLEGHNIMVSSVSFIDAGTRVASAAIDRTVRIWDVSTGMLVSKLGELEVGEAEGSVQSVAICGDGSLIMSDRHGSVQLWDMSRGVVVRVFQGSWGGAVISLGLSADGTRMLGCLPSSVLIWDVLTGDLITQLDGHTTSLYSAVFSEDGTRVVSGTFGGSVRIWDLSIGTPVARSEGHTKEVTSVAFSNDGTRVVSGSGDKSVRMWDVCTGKSFTKLDEPADVPMSVALLSDGGRVMCSNNRGIIRIWDLPTAEVVMEWGPFTGYMQSAAISSDGTLLAAGFGDGSVKIWDTSTGKLVCMFQTNDVLSVAFSSIGTLVSGSRDGRVRIWDVSKEVLSKEMCGHTAAVVSVTFSPNATHIASGSSDQSVRIWDVSTGRMIHILFEAHQGAVRSVTFSSNGGRLLSGSDDHSVRIWDVISGTLVAKLEGHTHRVESVAWTNDNTKIASGSYDKTIRIWDATSMITGDAALSPYIAEQYGADSNPTGWLLSPESNRRYLMFVPPSASLVCYPAVLCIGHSPHSVLSPFDYDYLGENWAKCYSPRKLEA